MITDYVPKGGWERQSFPQCRRLERGVAEWFRCQYRSIRDWRCAQHQGEA